MDVHDCTRSENHNWLSKTCRLAKGNASRVQKVHLFAFIVRGLYHLSMLEFTVGETYDYVIDKLLLAIREKLAEPPNKLAEQLLDQLVLQLGAQLLIELEF